MILPGKSVEEGSEVGDIYDFNHPGRYTVQVSRQEQGMPIVHSNSIVITVVPKAVGRGLNAATNPTLAVMGFNRAVRVPGVLWPIRKLLVDKRQGFQ